MYLRGALFPQAIAELRAALAEDSERIDVHVLLASALALDGKLEEAAQICQLVMQKLPYCLETTRLLAVYFNARGEQEKATFYRQRLQALDPYTGLVTSQLPAPDQVPDQAVSLERLNL